jgi:hypothetical protein
MWPLPSYDSWPLTDQVSNMTNGLLDKSPNYGRKEAVYAAIETISASVNFATGAVIN